MPKDEFSGPCVAIRNLSFSWGNEQPILAIPALTIGRQEKVFLQGPSGSGKSSLLGIIAGVFPPTAGEITVMGEPFHSLSASARDRRRADKIGFIFQQFNLVPYLTLVENVLLPCQFSKSRAERVAADRKTREEKAINLLSRLGLEKEAVDLRSASALSIGQQQRVAAARALIGSPSLVIADEPTSALDAETRDDFIETLLTESKNAALIFVSHDVSISKHFDKVYSLDELNSGLTGFQPKSNDFGQAEVADAQ